MLNNNNHFLKKLYEKDKEKTKEFFSQAQKDKQNINKQQQNKPHINIKKSKKMQTESTEQMTQSIIQQKEWCLDLSQIDVHNQHHPDIFGGQWLNAGDQIYKFQKVFHGKEWQDIISQKIQNQILKNQSRKCIMIQINCLGNENIFSRALIKYSLSLLKFGKCTWSVAAITSNKMFDLLSLQTQGSLLWKSKTPLSKVQLQKQSIMKRIFGFSIEKQKTIGLHQTLAKMVFSNNNIVYFILKNPQFPLLPSSSKLLIEQQTMIEAITQVQRYKIIFCQKPMPKQQLISNFKKIGINPKTIQCLSKYQKQKYLKSIIQNLQSQLNSKQKQLQYYQSNSILSIAIQQEICIPSERISMQEKYCQLQRSIKITQPNYKQSQ